MKDFKRFLMPTAAALLALTSVGHIASKNSTTSITSMPDKASSSTNAPMVDGPELFAYSMPGGTSGLRFAWRANTDAPWSPIGNGYNFVNSDFGAWGSHKKMFSPRLLRNASGGWACIWEADPKGGVTALARSADLISWQPQQYFASPTDLPRDILPAVQLTADSAIIAGTKVGGYRQRVDRALIDSLTAFTVRRAELDRLHAETCRDDSARYAALTAPVVCRVGASRGCVKKQISDKLIGIFFEDINYAADGGLYAELVRNRDFEFSADDHRGWHATTGWQFDGDGTMTVLTANPIHANNPHYLRLSAGPQGAALSNEGFDGIAVTKGDSYRFSIFMRAPRKTRVEVKLIDKQGKTIARGNVDCPSQSWQKRTIRLKANATAADCRLVLSARNATDLDIDMVSLFPTKTFKGRENGLRADLAQTLADLKPRFVRFPGGCLAHGNGVDNIYNWKESIGPLEARKPAFNLWGYHQTRGLGYHEYFEFCEDIGAEPLPVVAAGVPCQNSSHASHHSVDGVTAAGQQNGIPMDEMHQYVQDVLDLIEYANGDITTEWGAKRAAAGHPEPFNLKYIGIGNEDMITEVFVPRFKMIYDVVRAAHPEITIIGTVGPFYEGTDYEEGWRLARELEIPMVDEHYYVSPGWLVNNRDYYDNYDRKGTKVYLGEWASHLDGRPSNMETALSEALYMTDLERNADVVAMTSYAPLLAKEKRTQWRPDLIYFNNTDINLTPDYYVQKMYGNNAGTIYYGTELTSEAPAEAMKRVGVSLVEDEATGKKILKIVNMLPVAAQFDIDTEALGLKAGQYKAETLSGDPAKENVRPQTVTVSLPHVEVPPYSFTVINNVEF